MCIVHTFSEGWSLHKNPFRLCRSQAWTRSRFKITCRTALLCFVLCLKLHWVRRGTVIPPACYFCYAVLCEEGANKGAERLNFLPVFWSRHSCFAFQRGTSKWSENRPLLRTSQHLASSRPLISRLQPPLSEKNESRSAGGKERAGVSDPVVQAGQRAGGHWGQSTQHWALSSGEGWCPQATQP